MIFRFKLFHFAIALSLVWLKRRDDVGYYTIGKTMGPNVLFCDVDSKDFDIYETRDGIHLVANLEREFDYLFNKIRIAPKFDREGKIVNDEPKLIFCHCMGQHKDKRLEGKIHIYRTNSG